MSSPAERQSAPAARFLSVTELATRWGVAEKTVRRRIEDGSLAVHRFGRLLRIAERDVLVYEACARASDRM